MELWTVQILTDDGWVWGPPVAGMDIITEIVGGYFVGSLDNALQWLEDLAVGPTGMYRKPGTTRIMRVVMDSEPFIVI
jgi:hypothetical protein